MDASRRVVLSLWAGSLWTVGYLAAPTLFAVLDDRHLAGELAGRMFYAETWLSLICAGFLLVPYRASGSFRPLATVDNLLVLTSVSLLVLSEWLIRPLMVASRLPGVGPGQDFAMWHGVAATLYLFASIIALAAVWRSSVRREE